MFVCHGVLHSKSQFLPCHFSHLGKQICIRVNHFVVRDLWKAIIVKFFLHFLLYTTLIFAVLVMNDIITW